MVSSIEGSDTNCQDPMWAALRSPAKSEQLAAKPGTLSAIFAKELRTDRHLEPVPKACNDKMAHDQVKRRLPFLVGNIPD